MTGGRPHLHISEKGLTHTHSHARGNSVSTHFPNKNTLETVFLLTFRAKSCRKQCIYSLFEQKVASGSPTTHFSGKKLLAGTPPLTFRAKTCWRKVPLLTFQAKSCWKQRFFDEFSDRHIMNIPKGIEPKGRRKKLNLDALGFSFQQRGMI